MLSRLATEFAAEINLHDWSDAHERRDRAGHSRSDDKPPSKHPLDESGTDSVRINVMWVTAQVLLHSDPNLNLEEYALACGVPRSFVYRTRGQVSGALAAGIRQGDDGIAAPGIRW